MPFYSLTGQDHNHLSEYCGPQIHSATLHTLIGKQRKTQGKGKLTSSSETLSTHARTVSAQRKTKKRVEGRTRGIARWWWPWARSGATAASDCLRRGSPSTCQGYHSHSRFATRKSRSPNHDHRPSSPLADFRGERRNTQYHLMAVAARGRSCQQSGGCAGITTTQKQKVPLTIRWRLQSAQNRRPRGPMAS
jgi:hypothetical protein